MWSLQYDNTAYSFDHVAVTSVGIGGKVYRVDDTPNPRSDGIAFGQDFADPGDIELELVLTFQTVRNLGVQRAMLKEAAESFLLAWDAPALRSTPGALGDLIIPAVGLFEGRPRRAEWDWSTFGLGYLIGKATFIRAFPETYVLDGSESPWHDVEVGIVAPVGRSGWVFPLVFPIQNLEPDVRSTWFEVAGDTDASCIVSVYGPLQAGAEVEIASGFKLVTKRDLAYDEVAVADARPGRMTLTVNGEPSNFIAPTSTRLAELKLTPGPHQVSLRGISPQGTARARIEWRDTKAGI
ncbi:hypothetical protein PQI23_13270 [Leucobacter sp. USCH14]|uniref:hypothetical protein n=1 Tax=Leucobacter sp. USCH14 TaxID=3024838 RepID=UPI003096547D